MFQKFWGHNLPSKEDLVVKDKRIELRFIDLEYQLAKVLQPDQMDRVLQIIRSLLDWHALPAEEVSILPSDILDEIIKGNGPQK